VRIVCSVAQHIVHQLRYINFTDMKNNNTLSIQPELQMESKHSRFRFATAGWGLIWGLMVLIIGFFIEFDYLNKRSLNKFWYLFEPRYWSMLPIPILWGFVCWFFIDCLSYFDFIRKIRFWIRLVIFSAVFCVAAALRGWTPTALLNLIYHKVYITYVLGPVTNFMATGTYDWKTFVTPVAAVVLIVLLIILRYYKKK
jgi:hypothetical protein